MIWLVLFVISFTNGQEQIPKILMDVEDYYGVPADFQFLKVKTNEPDGVTYKWMKDGQQITEATRPPFTDYDSDTLWPSSKGSKEYAGVYQFVMTTKAGSIAGRKITVDFTYLGVFDPNLPSEDKKNVVIGQAYYLDCPKHEPGSHIFYKWGKSSEITGAKFMPDKDNYIVLDNGTLFYSHITQDDVTQFNDKEWKCAMEAAEQGNKFRWAEKVTITLNVVNTNLTEFGPKIVTELPQNKTFEEGDTISMKCAATGRPTPVYTWSRIDVYGQKHVVESGKDDMLYDGNDPRILVIKPAKRHHAGRYYCTATIGNKNDTVEGSLSFQVKPSWVGKRIESVTPSIYANHSWTCNATGFPEPAYKWYRNNVPVVNSASVVASGGSLTFTNLALSDSAMYECVAHNALDNIYQVAHMGVRAEKPVFDSNTGKQTIFLASKAVLKCHAKAAPAARNTWSKDGVDIDFTIPRYTLLNNEDLVIDTVSKLDVGNYTCKAANEFGTDTKKISVQVAGEITFIAEPGDVVTTRGSHDVKLRCQAKGDEHSANKVNIKYKWKFNGKDLLLNDSILWTSAYTLNFIDAQVSQSGVYECIAYIDQPSYAEKRRQATVIVKGPPDSPNKVQIDGDCSGFSAKLLWNMKPNNYEQIKYFVIQVATSYDPVWRNKTDRIAKDKYETTVTGLSPWTRYRFRVKAVNNIGTSPPSEPTVFEDCVTPEKVPAQCPTIEATPGKVNELTLKWKEIDLIHQNGRNFRYVLEYNAYDPDVSGNRSFNPKELEFDIPNAGYYRLWTYKIYGKNIIGTGPECRGSAHSGQNAPTTAPLDLTVKNVGDTYIVLEWKEIAMTRGSVDGYKLTYFQVEAPSRGRRSTGRTCDAKNPCEEIIPGGSTTSRRLDGLKPFTKYTIAVQGYNSGGAGPESSITVSTKEGNPGLPQIVKLVVYAKYIKLVWEEPAKPNGVITGYEVTIHRDANPKWHFSDTLDSTARKYVFGGLVPQKNYTVSVRAKTNDFGEKFADIVTTKALQAPAKPKAPLLEGIGKDGINVTFQEGAPEKGFPEKFIVVYRVKGGKEWTKTKPFDLYGPDGKPYVEISGLDNNKEYEVATIAGNGEGNSSRSDINTVVPGGSAPKAQNSPVYKRSWFVAVVVIVIFLLIVLLVALLITRKRGERYPVGKREKKRAGILDVGDDPDFNTYPLKPPRQNGNGVARQNSGGSLPNRDPDRDSLDEYGEDRFDEDAASLIGAYNDDRRPHNTVEEPEFV